MRTSGVIAVLLCSVLLQACVTVDEGPSQDERASAVNVQLGIGYLQQNKLELANDKLTKAIRQDPNSATAHNAYGILQERLGQLDKAEYHYEKATELDTNNSQAANNYGTFLCRYGRERESEKYFLRALENPLYPTPEFAYTNAAVCMMKVGDNEAARVYLNNALTQRSNFAPALITVARLAFEEADYRRTKVYLDRYHLVARPSAGSLWLDIRTALILNRDANVDELVERLASDFPDSEEYKAWLETQ